VRNRLSNISTRAKGLVTDDGPSNDLPWGRFEDRAVLRWWTWPTSIPARQDLVFARVVSKLREHWSVGIWVSTPSSCSWTS